MSVQQYYVIRVIGFGDPLVFIEPIQLVEKMNYRPEILAGPLPLLRAYAALGRIKRQLDNMPRKVRTI